MATQPQLYNIIARNVEMQEQLEKQEEQLVELSSLLMKEREKSSKLKYQADQLRGRIAELEAKAQAQKEHTVGWLPIRHLPELDRKASIEREAYEALEKKIVQLRALLASEEQGRKQLYERLVRAEQELKLLPQQPPPSQPAKPENIEDSAEYKELEANYAGLQEQYEAIISELNQSLTDSNRKLKTMEFKLEQLESEHKFQQSEFHVIG